MNFELFRSPTSVLLPIKRCLKETHGLRDAGGALTAAAAEVGLVAQLVNPFATAGGVQLRVLTFRLPLSSSLDALDNEGLGAFDIKVAPMQKDIAKLGTSSPPILWTASSAGCQNESSYWALCKRIQVVYPIRGAF